jgi:hypothetical protein
MMRWDVVSWAAIALLLCAADRVLPNEDEDVIERHRVRNAQRRAMRARGGRAGKAGR